MKYNGIDRVNNLGPYSLNNCVTCCKYCNRCKYDMTISEFKQYIKKIYNNFIKE
jgi:5-methylcytosine-specific restriction endonuclease McrA